MKRIVRIAPLPADKLLKYSEKQLYTKLAYSKFGLSVRNFSPCNSTITGIFLS